MTDVPTPAALTADNIAETRRLFREQLADAYARMEVAAEQARTAAHYARVAAASIPLPQTGWHRTLNVMSDALHGSTADAVLGVAAIGSLLLLLAFPPA